MPEYVVPTAEGQGGQLVPRCRNKHVSNPQDDWAAWKYRRCVRPERHKGRCAIRINGNVVRF